MAEIIKFKKPSIEDRFMESLSEYQLEMFDEIMRLIQNDFLKLVEENQKLTHKLAKKCTENELLKGEKNGKPIQAKDTINCLILH